MNISLGYLNVIGSVNYSTVAFYFSKLLEVKLFENICVS